MPDIQAKVVLQQCTSARLQVQLPGGRCEDGSTRNTEYVEIGRGLVVFVCFMIGATSQTVDKIVKMTLSAKLSETENGELVSILDLPGDVLIIPQATLGGSLKANRMQYHRNIDKQAGQSLYCELVQKCSHRLSTNEKSVDHGQVVQSGTYGNRQVFSCVTNGPYTHAIDI